MTNEKILDELYKKITTECVEFLADMESQDTATAIESAYEIVWKRNIAQFIEDEDPDLTEEQGNALLSSKNALDEIYEQFLSEENIGYRDLGFTFKEAADSIRISLDRETHKNVPLILHDAQTARDLGESGINDFRNSRKENIACAEALIAAAKRNITYSDMPGADYFNAGKTIDDVLNKGFPIERLGYVIASQIVRDRNYLNNSRIIDGRYSRGVKDWAINIFSQQENFPFDNFDGCDITSSVHQTLVNSLAQKFIDKQAELNFLKEQAAQVCFNGESDEESDEEFEP